MAVDAKRVGLYGAVGFLAAALIIVSIVISGVTIPSLRLPGFVPNTGTLIIRITDAPVDLNGLEITIDSVSVHTAEGSWIDLTFVGGESDVTFDLLQLRNLVTMDLCVNEVPSGKYTMIKIHIEGAVAVYEGGRKEDLTVPSGAIMVIVHFEVQSSEETTVTIDIEPDWVAISQHKNLRPVLKATVEGLE